MEHRTAAAFWQAYLALPREMQQRADKQFLLLKSNPQHPSLQWKKVGERRGQEVWSVRVSLQFRALALRREGGFLWFWIGDHKAYDLLIGG